MTDITFKFQKTSLNQWLIEWSQSDNLETGFSLHPSRTKAFNKMLRLTAPKLQGKDSFEVTYHIP